ncbi:hypothetical protein DY000_02054174 [Brassica cretica]|uniref:Uncharacterized protein n=1 Tax=Brassica cretica TaxID=69181 RepID=A0ABQ7AA79_BRACR|nr:hypothetical protein DY000_02054174 [Brassica cretica]
MTMAEPKQFDHNNNTMNHKLPASEAVGMKRIKSKSKDMKNLIDHGHEIMDRKSWIGNHGQEN